MSTKTTFKRIALVAVAALGLGVLTSVAPASAVAATATPFGVSAASNAPADSFAATVALSQSAGANNFVEFAAGIDGASAVHVVKVTGGTITNILTGSSLTVGTLNTAATELTYADGNLYTDANAKNAFRVGTPTAGTITVVVATRVTANGVVTDTTLQTFTVTVTAAAVANVYASSTVLGYTGDTSTVTAATTTTDAAWAVNASATAGTATAVGHISVVQNDANAVALTSGWKVITVSTTIGTLQTTKGTNAGSYVAVTPSSSSAVGFWVVPSGQAGAGTVTVAVNGVTVKSYAVNFYGALTTLTATVVNKQILSSVVKTGAVTVIGTDALGNVVPVTPTVTSATTASIASATCSTSTLTTASSCDLTAGATAGSSVLTFTSGLITTTATVSAAAKPTAVTLAFDKAEYNPGEAFVLTLTATNAAGVPGDATYANLLAGALATSQSLTTALFGASVALVDGKATAKGFMPLAAGPLTVSGTTGADATTAAVAVSASTTVLSDGVAQAAADAAAEATDAANAATDAANAAAEAADAATAAAQDAADAVAALSTQVSEMISALKKQITALTNLVIKIQKKVKA